MLLRILALAGVAFAGFKVYEKGREEGAFGGTDTASEKDTWDMIDDEDIPSV